MNYVPVIPPDPAQIEAAAAAAAAAEEARIERARRIIESAERRHMATLRSYWRTPEGRAEIARLFDAVRGRPMKKETPEPKQENATP